MYRFSIGVPQRGALIWTAAAEGAELCLFAVAGEFLLAIKAISAGVDRKDDFIARFDVFNVGTNFAHDAGACSASAISTGVQLDGVVTPVTFVAQDIGERRRDLPMKHS